jgi:hypothetical protein
MNQSISAVFEAVAGCVAGVLMGWLSQFLTAPR